LLAASGKPLVIRAGIDQIHQSSARAPAAQVIGLRCGALLGRLEVVEASLAKLGHFNEWFEASKRPQEAVTQAIRLLAASIGRFPDGGGGSSSSSSTAWGSGQPPGGPEQPPGGPEQPVGLLEERVGSGATLEEQLTSVLDSGGVAAPGASGAAATAVADGDDGLACEEVSEEASAGAAAEATAASDQEDADAGTAEGAADRQQALVGALADATPPASVATKPLSKAQAKAAAAAAKKAAKL